jgi:hypothetical protein
MRLRSQLRSSAIADAAWHPSIDRRPLELFRIPDPFRRGREDWVRWHRMEAARGLDVGRANGFVVRAEVDGFIADSAREAEGMPTLVAKPRSYAFVTAWLSDAVARG